MIRADDNGRGRHATCDAHGCRTFAALYVDEDLDGEALLAIGWEVQRAADTVQHFCPVHKHVWEVDQRVTCGEPGCERYFVLGDAPTPGPGKWQYHYGMSYCPDHRKDQAPKPLHPADAQLLIAEECDAIKAMLLEKNKAYGSSFSDPLRVFSKAGVDEQINVRLDDKLSRLARGAAAGEDVELDLMGYLVLKRVLRRMRGS